MSDNTLLRRHAEKWAEARRRPFDGDLLETVVDLRQVFDQLPATCWPAGTVESLLLERWPAHGPLDLPDPDALSDTLDTYWRFLRATGRMSSDSAAPADLLKEAGRALPRMAAACSDRTRFSSGRVLQDFGRSIGIRLEEASGVDVVDEQLKLIMAAWNDLPTAERRRLMPDPSPTPAGGQDLTDAVRAVLDFPDVPLTRGEPAVAARQVRESAYVRSCLALVDWVGDGREVTATGVLRPAVAREAYADLGLRAWDEENDRRTLGPFIQEELSDEVREVLARSALHSWKSAGECIALDRLWYACEGADLLQIGSRKATRAGGVVETDDEWVMLGLTLVYALVHRFESFKAEPLVAVLFKLAVAEHGRLELTELSRVWRDRFDGSSNLNDPELRRLLSDSNDQRLDWVLHMFGDTGLWIREGDALTVTDFGREFTVVLTTLVEDGYFDDEFDDLDLFGDD